LPDSAAKVYANLVRAALKAGVPVSYNDNPLLSASLPADLKVKLKDYNPQTDAMCAMLWDAYKVQVLKELVGEDDGDYIKESREELLEALREREKKHGYKAPLNANLTKPSRGRMCLMTNSPTLWATSILCILRETPVQP
jgi:hypothetical protein